MHGQQKLYWDARLAKHYTEVHGQQNIILRCTVSKTLYWDARSANLYTEMHGMQNIVLRCTVSRTLKTLLLTSCDDYLVFPWNLLYSLRFQFSFASGLSDFRHRYLLSQWTVITEITQPKGSLRHSNNFSCQLQVDYINALCRPTKLCRNHGRRGCDITGALLLHEARILHKVPYILESNPHIFYSFRGLKNQIWIRIACGLNSRSRAGFWKYNRAAVPALRTIQYNNLLFYSLFVTHTAR
jgi:hypothetical protein